MFQIEVEQAVAQQPPDLALLQDGRRPVGERFLQPARQAGGPGPEKHPNLEANQQRCDERNKRGLESPAKAALRSTGEGLVELQRPRPNELLPGDHLEPHPDVRSDLIAENPLLEVVIRHALDMGSVVDLDDHVWLQSWNSPQNGTSALAKALACRATCGAGPSSLRDQRNAPPQSPRLTP